VGGLKSRVGARNRSSRMSRREKLIQKKWDISKGKKAGGIPVEREEMRELLGGSIPANSGEKFAKITEVKVGGNGEGDRPKIPGRDLKGGAEGNRTAR